MKIRTSFVSNSSSSSFVIAYKKNNGACEHCGRHSKFEQFLSVITHFDDGDSSGRIEQKDAESILDDCKKDLEYDDSDYLKEKITKVEKAVADGWEVVKISLPHGVDSGFNSLFKKMEKEGDIKIICSDG